MWDNIARETVPTGPAGVVPIEKLRLPCVGPCPLPITWHLDPDLPPSPDLQLWPAAITMSQNRPLALNVGQYRPGNCTNRSSWGGANRKVASALCWPVSASDHLASRPRPPTLPRPPALAGCYHDVSE